MNKAKKKKASVFRLTDLKILESLGTPFISFFFFFSYFFLFYTFQNT